MLSRLLLLLALVGSIALGADDCCVKVDPVTKQLIDAHGRARLFHGVNVVYKSFPYYPSNLTFDPEFSLVKEDIDFLVESGFTVVRLYIAWPGYETEKGVYNETYLDVLAEYVNTLGKAGIYTILDCHQDLLSPKFCGEGVPDYAALYRNGSTQSPKFPVPFPSLFSYPTDPDTGYPYRHDCNKHSFFLYYFSDAVCKSWQSFYDNEEGVLDGFKNFWEQVAIKFRGNPNVLGYELLNEPWAGDIYRHPSQLIPANADFKNLMPMYSILHSAIRSHDKEHIIFFEPTVIITSLPFKFSETGLTEGPGGADYNDRQVLSYHLYCILLDKNGQPMSTRLCDGVEEDVVRNRLNDMNKLGVAGFMTEWGAYSDHTVPGSKPYEDGLKIMGLADKYLQSWAYWQYKGYGDFTTQSSIAEGLWFENGTIQNEKVKLLSRSYALAVSGRFVSQSFDPSTSNFTVKFVSDPILIITQSTIIYINEKYYYPAGFTVSISPARGATYSTSHNRVTVTLIFGLVIPGQEITIRITAK